MLKSPRTMARPRTASALDREIRSIVREHGPLTVWEIVGRFGRRRDGDAAATIVRHVHALRKAGRLQSVCERSSDDRLWLILYSVSETANLDTLEDETC